METGYTQEYTLRTCRDRISQILAGVQTSREYEGQEKDISTSKTATEENTGLLLNSVGTRAVHRKGQSTEEQILSGLP